MFFKNRKFVFIVLNFVVFFSFLFSKIRDGITSEFWLSSWFLFSRIKIFCFCYLQFLKCYSCFLFFFFILFCLVLGSRSCWFFFINSTIYIFNKRTKTSKSCEINKKSWCKIKKKEKIIKIRLNHTKLRNYLLKFKKKMEKRSEHSCFCYCCSIVVFCSCSLKSHALYISLIINYDMKSWNKTQPIYTIPRVPWCGIYSLKRKINNLLRSVQEESFRYSLHWRSKIVTSI